MNGGDQISLGVGAGGISVGIASWWRAGIANRVADRAILHAQQANALSEESNVIALESNKIAGEANEYVRKRSEEERAARIEDKRARLVVPSRNGNPEFHLGNMRGITTALVTVRNEGHVNAQDVEVVVYASAWGITGRASRLTRLSPATEMRFDAPLGGVDYSLHPDPASEFECIIAYRDELGSHSTKSCYRFPDNRSGTPIADVVKCMDSEQLLMVGHGYFAGGRPRQGQGLPYPVAHRRATMLAAGWGKPYSYDRRFSLNTPRVPVFRNRLRPGRKGPDRHRRYEQSFEVC